ncbi:MAG: TlpA disulfide reductase family protein [Acidobacteriota bacterium]
MGKEIKKFKYLKLHTFLSVLFVTLPIFHGLYAASSEREESARLISAGEKAKPFTGKDVKGEFIDLTKYLGKNYIYLNFFTTWCGRCNWETKGINKIYSEYKGEDVVFFRINLMEKEKLVADFAKKYNIPFSVILDEGGKISKFYGIKYVPVNIIIDKKGIVQFAGGLLSEGDLRRRLKEVINHDNIEREARHNPVPSGAGQGEQY